MSLHQAYGAEVLTANQAHVRFQPRVNVLMAIAARLVREGAATVLTIVRFYVQMNSEVTFEMVSVLPSVRTERARVSDIERKGASVAVLKQHGIETEFSVEEGNELNATVVAQDVRLIFEIVLSVNPCNIPRNGHFVRPTAKYQHL